MSKRSPKARKRAQRAARRRTCRAERQTVAERQPARAEADRLIEDLLMEDLLTEDPPIEDLLIENPLIGYVAHDGPAYLCDGDGCVVAGSRERLRELLQRSCPSTAHRYTIQAAPFWDILKGMEYGGAYCLDETAYGRFLGPGRRIGLPLKDENFRPPGAGPLREYCVRLEFPRPPLFWSGLRK